MATPYSPGRPPRDQTTTALNTLPVFGGSKANRAPRYSGNPGPVKRAAQNRMAKVKASLPSTKPGRLVGSLPALVKKERKTFGPVT